MSRTCRIEPSCNCASWLELTVDATKGGVAAVDSADPVPMLTAGERARGALPGVVCRKYGLEVAPSNLPSPAGSAAPPTLPITLLRGPRWRWSELAGKAICCCARGWACGKALPAMAPGPAFSERLANRLPAASAPACPAADCAIASAAEIDAWRPVSV